MAASNRERVLAGVEWVAPGREGVLWTLALLFVALDVALVATDARPVAPAPARLAIAAGLDPLAGLVALKGVAVGLAVAAWWVLPTNLRTAVPGVLAGASAGVILAGAL